MPPETPRLSGSFTLKNRHIPPTKEHLLALAKSTSRWHPIRDYFAIVDDQNGDEIRMPARQLCLGGLVRYNEEHDENISWEAENKTTNDAIRILVKLGIRVSSFRRVAD